MLQAQDLVTHPVLTLRPLDEPRQAEAPRRGRVRHVPVVEGERLVGLHRRAEAAEYAC